MSDGFYKRLSILAGLFVLAGTFALTIFVANLEVKDLDLWLHLGMGRHIVENGFQVPNQDILSCTIAGRPWINHEWLFQILVHTIYSNAGVDGLILMQVILVTTTLLLLALLGYNRDKQLGSIYMLLLVSLVYQQRFTMRPDLYSLLFFVLYIITLSHFLGKKWTILFVFVLQVLWTNIHGFFFFGPLFVMIGLFAEWLKRHVRLPYHWNKTARLDDKEYRQLKIILGAVILACLFNPQTFHGAWYPLRVFFHLSTESKVFFERIIELQRPIQWSNIFDFGIYPYYKLLIIFSFLSIVFNRRRLDIGVVILWLIFLGFSLSAVRNLIFFSFAAYLVFVTNALTVGLRDFLPVKITDKKFIHLVSTSAKVFLVIWLMGFADKVMANGYYDFDKFERKSEFGGISQRQYPDKAVKFLVDNQVKGNFFNDFNSGAYLIGHCFPDIKVFIDGRTEVYGADFFKNYMEIWQKGTEESFGQVLDQYHITGVLLNSAHEAIPKPALQYLKKSPDWLPVYLDYDGMIYLKDVPQNREVIDKYSLDLENWQVERMDTYRMGPVNALPYRFIHRAYTLNDLGYHDAAIAEAKEALRVKPNFLAPYKILGKIYAGLKDYEKAFENFRVAILMDPVNSQLRLNLALAYYDLEKYDYARNALEKMLKKWPDHVRARFKLAQTYAQLGRFNEAYQAAQKGLSLDKRSGRDVVAIGNVILEKNYPKDARVFYELAATAEKGHDVAYEKLGDMALAEGKNKSACQSYERGFEINPENTNLEQKLCGPSTP